jgi:hypothetical protein
MIKDIGREQRFKRLYGITTAIYEEMKAEQNGRCYICGKTESENRKSLAVDHCHKTKVIRALLCDDCNWCLGKVGDNIELLRKMINYLQAEFRDRKIFKIK